MDLPKDIKDSCESNGDSPEIRKEESLNDFTKTETPSSQRSKHRTTRLANNKRKTPFHPSVPEMILQSMKSLERNEGTSIEEILNDLEEKYGVNPRVLKSDIDWFLKNAVHQDFIEQVHGVGDNELYKIKKEDLNVTCKREVNGIHEKRVDKTEKDISELRKEESLNEPAATESDSSQESNHRTIKFSKKKRKTPSHPSVSEMVLQCIKSLKRDKGISAEEILSHLGEKYNFNFNMKVLKSHVNWFLKNAVRQGIIEQVHGVGDNGLYKIKKDNTNVTSEAKDSKTNEKELGETKKDDSELRSKENVIETSSSQESEDEDIRPSKRRMKTPSHPSISQMVTQSIKSLKKSKGTSAEEILSHIRKKYKYNFNMKVLKSHVIWFLKNAVRQGIIEQVQSVGDSVLYKIKKGNQKVTCKERVKKISAKGANKTEKGNQNSVHNEKNVKMEGKLTAV